MKNVETNRKSKKKLLIFFLIFFVFGIILKIVKICFELGIF